MELVARCQLPHSSPLSEAAASESIPLVLDRIYSRVLTQRYHSARYGARRVGEVQQAADEELRRVMAVVWRRALARARVGAQQVDAERGVALVQQHARQRGHGALHVGTLVVRERTERLEC